MVNEMTKERIADLKRNCDEIEKSLKEIKKAISSKNAERIYNYTSRIDNNCADIYDILDCIREDEEIDISEWIG